MIVGEIMLDPDSYFLPFETVKTEPVRNPERPAITCERLEGDCLLYRLRFLGDRETKVPSGSVGKGCDR